MTGLVRKTTLFSACGLLMAVAAFAGIPNAAMSDTDSTITIADADNPSSSCLTASFVIRDAAGDPVPGGDVTLEFATCAGADLPLVCLTQPDPGAIISSINKTISKSADGLGAVSFRIWGTGTHPTLPGSEPDCVRVYANSVLMWVLKWRLHRYDMDGTGAPLAGTDGGIWIDRFDEGVGVINGWGDYDCTGTPVDPSLAGTDGGLWIDAFDAGLAVCTPGAAW